MPVALAAMGMFLCKLDAPSDLPPGGLCLCGRSNVMCEGKSRRADADGSCQPRWLSWRSAAALDQAIGAMQLFCDSRESDVQAAAFRIVLERLHHIARDTTSQSVG